MNMYLNNDNLLTGRWLLQHGLLDELHPPCLWQLFHIQRKWNLGRGGIKIYSTRLKPALVDCQEGFHSVLGLQGTWSNVQKCLETEKKKIMNWNRRSDKLPWIHKVSRNRRNNKYFVRENCSGQGAPNDLEYGRGGHWKRKMSRNRKTTKSFVMQNHYRTGGHRTTF